MVVTLSSVRASRSEHVVYHAQRRGQGRGCVSSPCEHFTGSKDHSVKLRELAVRRGLRISEYGVFEEPSGRRIAGLTETDVYATVGHPWIPPELRENRGEIEAAREGRLPRLVTAADIRGDLHAHTDWSDGHHPIGGGRPSSTFRSRSTRIPTTCPSSTTWSSASRSPAARGSSRGRCSTRGRSPISWPGRARLGADCQRERAQRSEYGIG
jgi:DNA polymerase beta thumb